MAILVTTQAKRDAWTAAGYLGRCGNGIWANPTFYGKTIGGVPIRLVDAYKALETVLKATGYEAISRWAYNFRQITGGSLPCSCGDNRGCSPHAFGISIDIDPAQNPYTTAPFSWNATKFTPAQIAAVEAIKNTKGEQMWAWGGRWRSVRDYMHFDVQVDPRSVEVDWSTVQGAIPEGDDDMWNWIVVDETLVRHAWESGWLDPKTPETLNYFIGLIPELNNPNSDNQDVANFKRAVTNGIARSSGLKGDKGDKGDKGEPGRDGRDGRDGMPATLTIRGDQTIG